MHEMSLVESILESLLQMKKENQWKKINKVTLRIGKMRQVIPEIMEFAYNTSVSGTDLEGSRLSIDQVEMEFFCKSCLKKWGEEDMAFVCPFCDSTHVEMLHGMELDIDTLEVEEKDG